MKHIKWKTLFICILIPELVGVMSGWLTRVGMKQFELLQKPIFTPPKIVFPIVWTILFLLMGMASYYVFTSKSQYKKTALWIYTVQLVVNFFWSIIFFNLQWRFVAVVWLCLLILFVSLMMYLFYRCKPLSGWLLLPYLIWLFVAAYLNFLVYLLNR